MQIRDVLDLSLGDLEFDKNRSLFFWPADLITDNTDPVGGALDAVAERSFEQQRYFVDDGDSPPIGWGNHPEKEAPTGGYKQLRELQDRIKVNVPRDKSPELVFARPTTTAAFSVVQHQLQKVREQNRKILSLELDITNIVGGVGDIETYDDYWEGVVYVLNHVCKAVLDVALLHVPLAQGLGVDGSVQVVRSHLLSRGHKEHIEHHISWFKSHDYVKMCTGRDRKDQRIREQLMLWSEAGRQPVVNADGSINHPCSLSNTATALVAVRQLSEVAIALYCFCKGAEAVLQHLSEALEV